MPPNVQPVDRAAPAFWPRRLPTLLWWSGPDDRRNVPRGEALLLTREDLLDILAAELGTFDDRMADARKHLLEPRADLTLADLFGALLDSLGRPVDLALVSSPGRTPGQGHREEHGSDPQPVTFRHHDTPPF